MSHKDLDQYCDLGIEAGAAHAKIIHPGTVITALWVRLKCQFGCAGYGKKYSCPPDTPSPEQMRSILDTYHRAIIFHAEPAKGSSQSARKARVKLLN